MLYNLFMSDHICGNINIGIKETNAPEEVFNKICDLVFINKNNLNLFEADKQIEDILKIKGYEVNKINVKNILIASV